MVGEKVNVVKSAKAKACSGRTCPFCSPYSLAAFLVGGLVIFYAPRPYQIIGWIVFLSAYIVPLLRMKLR